MSRASEPTYRKTEIVRKIESLYRNEAAKQVETAQRNVLADYGELFRLRNDVKSLTENNDDLKSTLETIFDQFANPSLRSKIFAIADALIGGTHLSPFPPVAVARSLIFLGTVADRMRRKKRTGRGA